MPYCPSNIEDTGLTWYLGSLASSILDLGVPTDLQSRYQETQVARVLKQFIKIRMLSRSTFVLGMLAFGASKTLAHSFISNINIDGLLYEGFYPTSPGSHPFAVGWATTAFDQGYVNQTGYTTPQIICHRGATNAHAHAEVNAGDRIQLQWHGWPQSHKGPVMDYLASCGNEDDTCETVNKTDLRFFKIDEMGLLNGTDTADGGGGLWATDLLIANNNSWVTEIPPQIKPGPYVLRTEIIALHNASNPIGAQNYPQCVNIRVRGSGTLSPNGTLGMDLYNPNDPSMHLNIYAGLSTYKIPGPPLISVAETVSLSHPVPTGIGPIYTGTGTMPVYPTITATTGAES
ncbi:glycosyl hydrolase family 61-domain-containing protein [Xylariaceae sp. FL0255]|nr:glycosyl hydrolase family 61-domain-containing protein [Xylariaceae sp. FL0255]